MNERSFVLFTFGILFGFVIGSVSMQAHAEEIREGARRIFNNLPYNDMYEAPETTVLGITVALEVLEQQYQQYQQYVAYTKYREEVACLRDNIFFEARNQSERGQIAVGLVTINRTRNKFYPDTICGVVYDGIRRADGSFVANRCQFSWVCARQKPRVNFENQKEVDAYAKAEELAEKIIAGEVDNFLEYVTHYHADYVSPDWSESERMVQVGTYGNHIFYKDRLIARQTI